MGSGFKNFTATVLTASDVNNYLMEQSVMSFASTGARDVQVTAPEDGMVAYIRSNDSSEGLYTYNGTAWRKGPGWNAPWGVITNISSTSNTITSNTVAGLSYTLDAVANRLYQITVTVKTSWSVAGRVVIRLEDNAVALQRLSDYTTTIAADRVSLGSSVTRSFTAGSHPLTVAFLPISGTVVLGAEATANSHELTITDIGPSGAPV